MERIYLTTFVLIGISITITIRGGLHFYKRCSNKNSRYSRNIGGNVDNSIVNINFIVDKETMDNPYTRDILAEKVKNTIKNNENK